MNSIIEAAQARRAAPVLAASPLTLHVLQPHEYGRWDAFVRACPDATFFHLSGWQKVIEASFVAAGPPYTQNGIAPSECPNRRLLISARGRTPRIWPSCST